MIRAMAEETRRRVEIEYPNRAKSAVRVTRLIVILLLLISVGLMLVVTIGGWSALAGAKPELFGIMAVYLILAFYAARWTRGTLPLAAALGVLMIIFSLIAGPQWFERDKTGFTQPTLDANVVGLITLLIAPVSLLLVAFAMRGFQQEWNVEVEHKIDEPVPPSGSTAASPA